MTHSDGVVTMEIIDCKPEDSGNYKCVATNIHGTDDTSCVVIVEGNGKRSIRSENQLWQDFFKISSRILRRISVTPTHHHLSYDSWAENWEIHFSIVYLEIYQNLENLRTELIFVT